MKRVDQILDLVRERTRNLNFATDSSGNVTEGMSNNLLLDYMNQGQDHLQAAILAVYPNEFIESVVISIVAGQEDYEIEDRLFINNKIVCVEVRNNTTDQGSYVPLDQGIFRNRKTYRGYPEFYLRKGNIIKLNPIPQSSQGDVRITYYRELDDLDIRRGTITARTISAGAITAMTLDTATDDPIALADADFICVNDRYGVVTMYNIPITGYNSDTGVVTIAGGTYTFDTGETAAVGSYVTVGKYTTTTSKLPDNAERYLGLYTQKRVLTTDESNTDVTEDVEVKTAETDIINSFADEDRDVQYIPVIDVEGMW